MRILVTGSRDWPYWNMLNDALNKYANEQDIVIVHGDCPTGADAMAQRWAEYQGVVVERYPAPWERYGKRAGFIRNSMMVAMGADVCLAFILNGSKGASMTARLADEAGIEVIRYEVNNVPSEGS